MKKVIFVIPQFKNGGGNRVFIELANFISNNKNLDVEIVYPNNSIEINHYKIEKKLLIKKIGKTASNILHKLLNTFLLYLYIFKNLRDYKYSLVIISDPILCNFLWLLPRKFDEKIIRFVQADDYNIFDDLFILKNKLFLFIYKRLTRHSYNLNFKYIFNSKFTYHQFVKVSNRLDLPCDIVHPSVDKTVFNESTRLLNKLNQKISISLVARDHPLKRFKDFLSMWSELDEKTKSKIEKIFIISTDRLNDFNISEFHLVKPVSDKEIADVFRLTDIFISTSMWEGFSLPPLEALNCGAVVLSSNSGGINEYALNNYNALLYEPGDTIHLKNNLINLIENVELRDYLSTNSKKTIDNFSWNKSGENFMSIIQNQFLLL